MRYFPTVVLMLAASIGTASVNAEELVISEANFGCMLDTHPVRGFYTGHGCGPIPLTPQMSALWQKTDARCGRRYTPTAEEMEMLKALAAQLSARP